VTTWLLAGLAVVAGYVAPIALSRSQWPLRAPSLGAIRWLTTALVCASAAVLAVATVAIPAAVAGHGLADLWNACLSQWRHYYGDASTMVVASAGAVTVMLIGSIAWSAVHHHRTVLGFRQSQHSGLAPLKTGGEPDIVMLAHPAPAAYCVPGRPGRVVLTEGAVRALGPDQIRGVVAHERAHLNGRHATLIAVATVLRTSMGWLAPVFRRAPREVAALTEMSADDAAAAICPPVLLVEALVALADGVVPRAALGASDTSLTTRVYRLLSPSRPVSPITKISRPRDIPRRGRTLDP
jgi:Zn-dependent protease with chaperone function